MAGERQGTVSAAVAARRCLVPGWRLTHHPRSYFTFLSYWGLTAWLLVSGLHTLVFALAQRRPPPSQPPLARSYPLQRWPRPLQALHRELQATVYTFPPLVTLTFWIVLYGPSVLATRVSTWSNISEHGLNSLFFLVELLLTNGPPPKPLTVVPVVVVLALYLGLAYLTYATQGWYTYDFLDPAEGPKKRAAYICGLLAASIIIWGITTAIAWGRTKLVKGRAKGVVLRRTNAGAIGKGDVEMERV